MNQRLSEYIDSDYSEKFCEGVKKLMQSWEEYREEKFKAEEITQGSEEQVSEEEESEEEDSFIVEDDDFDIEGGGHPKKPKKQSTITSKKQD